MKPLNDYIDLDAITRAAPFYGKEGPFDHAVVDGFFTPDFAAKLEAEFPAYDSPTWHQYDNAIEIKKTCNSWNAFPANTYQAFAALNSPEFVDLLSQRLLKGRKLYQDAGLNGGGWHIHGRGGKLNTHLDYSLHPKSGLQRKLNIIVYMNSAWQPAWGGQLGLWDSQSAEAPGALKKSIDPVFNRAVIFDTTQNSWHGLPSPLTCPEGEVRRSLAVYYLCDPAGEIDQRGKAFFAPTDEQKDDPQVLELIRKRAETGSAASVYTRQTK